MAMHEAPPFAGKPAAAVAWFDPRAGYSPLASHALASPDTPATQMPVRALLTKTRAGNLSSDLLDLTVFELDRSGPTKDRHLDLEPRALLVDFLHRSVERRERTVGNPHLLADLEGDRRLRPFDTFLDRIRMRSASESGIGTGLESLPRNPVTFGVFLIRWNASSVRSARTMT